MVAFSFFLLGIGSTVYVSAAALNYLGFYPALDQVQAKVASLTLAQSSSINQSNLIVLVKVSNPTGYSGLRIGDISVTLSLYVETNKSNTLFVAPDELFAKQIIQDQLRPNSIYSASIPIELSPQQTAEITSFSSQYKGEVMAVVVFTVDIVTFLQSVTGPSQYTQTQYVTLSTG